MKGIKKTQVIMKKGIAIFLLVTLLNQLMLPSVAYALTSGPTAPEATNFEPIDTTDMVNPLTGDFTYNMPLLEIPGPEGGYPLSLSYHAAIQPNEDASWVGLGWTLNPGAIARNVNGYADDWKNVTGNNRSYWAGGETRQVGVNVGIGLGPASVNFGLSFAQDTYKGFGVGESMGLGVNLGDSPFNVGVSIGVSPYGEGYEGIDIGVSTSKGMKEGLVGSASIGLTTNFKQTTYSASGGVSYSNGKGTNVSLLGASISSTEGKTSASMSVGGGSSSSVNNANAGRIQTQSNGFFFMIPLPLVSVGVSYNYQRYWSDEKIDVQTNGALYNPDPTSITDNSYFAKNAFDTYRLLNTVQTNIIDNPDPDRIVGGTYPNFDNYSVTAQGLSGNIRPYAFQNVLYSQNKTNDQDNSNDVVENVPTNINIPTKNNFQFRFINDFSNKYTQQAVYDPVSEFTFDTNPSYGQNTNDGGYNPQTNQLEGSKHIEYFTNSEILNSYSNNTSNRVKELGFITGGYEFDNRTMGNGIGGFMITNSSGVTYHYALPAYSYDEMVHTEKVDQSGGNTYNELRKNASYAYTWYLTAITGPDFVDINNNGIVDNDDLGYWVKFDYGKWTDNYQWRNPSEGFNRDVDNEFQSYSTGKKDVYYLDAITTRTHTALFIKERRTDAKSLPETYDYAPYQVVSLPKSSLRLNEILLLKNDQFASTLAQIRVANGAYNYLDYNIYLTPHNGHYGDNVIDVNDIGSLSENLEQKCLRKIQFNYDYSLCPGTFNSYDPSGQMYVNYSSTISDNLPKLGKLTLLSVDFRGKGGVATMPPVEFQYDLDPNDPVNSGLIMINQVSGNQGTIAATGHFSEGDILSFSIGGIQYYCTITSATGGGNFKVVYLNNSPPANSSLIVAHKTKNPPYNKDACDIWGCYKSDYISGSNNENLSRLVSPVSNKGTDVWSLRKIKSSLGSEISINYEGDTYGKSVLNNNMSLTVSNINKVPNQDRFFSMTVNAENMDIGKIFHLGDKIDIIILKSIGFSYGEIAGQYFGTGHFFYTKNSRNYPEQVVITAINGSDIQVEVGLQMNSALCDEYEKFPSDAYYSERQCVYLDGNISTHDNSRFYGGGLRVKDITTDNLNGQVIKRSYQYTPLNGDGNFSSGVTSYEPLVFDVDNVARWEAAGQNNARLDIFATPYDNDPKKSFRSELYKDINYLLPLSTETPAPGVMYEYVTEYDSNLIPDVSQPDGYREIPMGGKTVYQFEVFNRGMLGLKQYYFNSTNTTRRLNVSIKDYTSRIGNLKRMITYDDKGNKLTEKINHYLHDDIDDKSFETQVQTYEPRLSAYNNLGVIQERYADARIVHDNGTIIDKSVMSGRDVYPAIQTGTTQIDYKNGTTTDQQNLAFDFYSGNVIKTKIKDSYGNMFVTESTPAYHIYPGMSFKNITSTNKNMLTQEASNYTFKVDNSGNKTDLVSGTVQTWDNQTAVIDQNGNNSTAGQGYIWRMKSSYKWLSSGTTANNITPYNSFEDYFLNPGNPSWKKTSEITLYDVYSKSLEGTDINNNYVATRMGYNNTKVIVSGGPAKYNEIAYSGVEDGFKNNTPNVSFISQGSGTVNTTFAHTGSSCLDVSGGGQGFNYTVPLNELSGIARDYSVAVWVKPSAANQSDAGLYYQIGSNTQRVPTLNYTKQAAGWYLLEMRIPKSDIIAGGVNGNLVIGCRNNGLSDLYFDDFRFQPTNASVMAYVYDIHTGELNYILGNNNLFTKFEYDEAGRLVKTYKEVLGKSTTPILNSTSYHYGRMN